MKHGLHWNVFICRSLQYLKAPDTIQNKLHFLAPVWLLGCCRNQRKNKQQDHVYLEINALKCMTVTESRTDSISLSILLWHKALIQAMWTSFSILEGMVQEMKNDVGLVLNNWWKKSYGLISGDVEYCYYWS